MSDWSYVVIAYTLVWGAIALYALLLARRVAQAREAARHLRETELSDREATVCDVPPAR